MLPSETMIWQPEFTDKTLSRKIGAVHYHVLEPETWARMCKRVSGAASGALYANESGA
ncbi:TPA: DUF3440 domain-containing protein [Escherichia coli]|nr:DUF3440 domain-containing protein [Escherichia coli]HAJ6967719.1 DUF3440 domain-containing protein [Escherichia coli]